MIVDPPALTLKLLNETIAAPNADSKAQDAVVACEEELAYVAALASALTESSDFDHESWSSVLSPYVDSMLSIDDSEFSAGIINKFRIACERAALGDIDEDSDSEDEGEDVCNIRFNLAYGGKILLHQTRLRLRRGHRYGLIGQNGAGKTTLMNAINNGKLDGWPTNVKTEYVDSGSNVDPVYEAQVVLPYLIECTGKGEEAKTLLQELKFTEQMMIGTIGELSGGWQMKLRLCRAVLKHADILLLDEPTNHLDTKTVQWLTNYLLGLTDTTVVTVSHDTAFMEDICTDVIHYEKRDGWIHRKLVNYRGTMSAFVKKQPQAKHYFELATTDLKFKFPDPGRLEGVRTSTQTFLEMGGVNFRYPGCDQYQLTDVNLKLTLSSRVVVLGANGAGKTTLVKMMVGDTTPSNLGGCKFFIHHNLRVAYVAQHSFHHVEQHMESSPAAYIQWRFKDGYDKEKIQSAAFRISEEEQEKIDAFNLEGIWSRRVRAGVVEYEVKKKNVREKDNRYYSKDELLDMGFEKLLRQTDEKIASKEAGLDLRPVTTTEIQKHLDDFGLPQEFGTYGKVRGLSGGQKVKLVLAAAMWTNPHLLILDEPTNYLDRESLGALSSALNEWGGAVLMISHNKEFYSSVCREEWHVRDGKVFIEGISKERKMKAVSKKKKYDKELDDEAKLEKAGGNMNANGDKYKDATLNFWGQTMAKKEVRNYDKAKKKGDVALMRKILQVPQGKIMPGFEELGDGTNKN
uniref:ABC transporter domain-containing protein n=1 Tax=Leptocylindrus danicus TaxID=163516 RepID=A0A7S2LGB8_9STRA